jgi:hypothetical protein
VYDSDLHQCNIAFEIPDLDGKPEENAMMTLGVPQCVPVFARDQRHHTDSLPKYLVIPGDLTDCVEQDDMHLKIIDLGEGSLRRPQLFYWTLNSYSVLQCRSSSSLAHSVTSSSTRSDPQSPLCAAQCRIQHANRRLVDGVSGASSRNHCGIVT